MGPLRIEVLTRAPTEFFHCQHCEVAFQQVGIGKRFRADQRAAALPPELQEEYAYLGEWIADLARRYGDRIQIDVVDVASIEGFIKALRYRAWRYPFITVDGEVVYRPGQSKEKNHRPDNDEGGLDLGKVTERIERRLAV
jgi:hypothetical protein